MVSISEEFSFTFAQVKETFLLVRKTLTRHNTHMYETLRLFCIVCEVMFTALVFFREVLDLHNCR